MSRSRPFAWFIHDDGGYTALAMVLASVLALALVITGSKVLWVNSAAADPQIVADASALAAMNVVASYINLVRLIDAVMLSMSLVGIFVFLVATVVACVPGINASAQPVFDFGRQIVSARNKFGSSAEKGLQSLQAAMPLLMQAKASAVSAANSRDEGISYACAVIPFPLMGDAVDAPNDATDVTSVDASVRSAKSAADETKRWEDKMRADLEEAYRLDCVDAPSCLMSRAQKLAGLTGSANPKYASSQGWSFAVPLARAKAYYARRSQTERPVNQSIEEQVKSRARAEFFKVAIVKLNAGYAPSTGDLSQGLNLPLLPKNTAEMRSTTAYTSVRYPVFVDGQGRRTMHFSALCTGTSSQMSSGTGTLSQLERGVYSRCSVCKWDIGRIGSVPAASTNINNGFEYYYRRIALKALDYRESAAKYRSLNGSAKRVVETSGSIFKQAMKSLAGKRFDPKPPGAQGCVVVVFDPRTRTDGGRIGTPAQIAPRLALSAAALASESPQQGSTLLAQTFDRLLSSGSTGQSQTHSPVAWMFKSLGAVWGDALYVYLCGSEALTASVVKLLDSVPGFAQAGISSWAKGFIDDTVKACGLQPAKVDMPRPLLVNTLHVLNTDPKIGSRLAQAKYRAMELGASDVPSVLDSLVDEVVVLTVERLSNELVIARVDIGGVVEVPVTVKLPESIIERAESSLRDAALKLSSTWAGLSTGLQGMKRWE